jgi:hypothetical protein
MNKSIVRLALISAAVAGASGPASATHQWGKYHWARTSNPVTLRINTALSGGWPAIVQKSIGEWNASAALNFSQSGTNGANSYLYKSSNTAKQCNPIAGQILVCNALYGQRGWLGIATIWANGDHITQGTTKLNDTYVNQARYNTPYWRAMVACQEVGHDFGLGHVNETFTDKNTGSCMDYTNDPSGKNAQNGPLENDAPNSHDFAMLGTMYGHADSTTTARASASTNFGQRTVGQAAPQARVYAGAGDTAVEWGSAVRRDGKGRPDMFVRKLPDGTLKITHVLWAPDAKGKEAGPVHEDDGHTH